MAAVTGMSALPLYRVLPDPGPEAGWLLAQSALGLVAALAMASAFAPRRRGGAAPVEAAPSGYAPPP
jgi:hypothetical protein